MLYFGFLLCLFWLTQSWTVIHFLHAYKLTDKNKVLAPLKIYPKVSIIVTARDEGEKIGHCLTSLLNMAYPDFEIIAVNDRSRDETAEIMKQLATQDKRIKAVHISELPEGWLGKVHAMHCGSHIASGEFLLFTDGDVIFENNALEQAVRYAKQHKLAQLCLIPRFLAGDIWETGLVNFFGMVFLMSTRPQAVNSLSSQFYAGVGAFNLVQKQAYQQIGGHQSLRLEIVDDMRLGRLLKQSGLKTHLLVADDLISLKWHVGVLGVIKGIEKNSFAAIDFSLLKLLLLTLIFSVLTFFPYFALFQPTLANSGFLLTLAIMHGSFAYCCEKFHSGHWKITWTLPIAAFFTLCALWNSAIVTLWQGGVKWRDTFYPLKMLKQAHYQ